MVPEIKTKVSNMQDKPLSSIGFEKSLCDLQYAAKVGNQHTVPFAKPVLRLLFLWIPMDRAGRIH